MTFVDRAVIRVTAGTGGSGAVSFRHEKFVPKGGPNGGDGGRGGSVYVRADQQLATLLDYTYHTHWKAARGEHGKGANKTGRSADDVYLPVPPGTEVHDVTTGEILGELCEPGAEGEDREIELVLKLIADVGLLGPPNAGKSTLLSVVSAARPKIADYPFTTLTPNLGVVGLSDGRSFAMADIPGIIEGAHAGRGLGDRFLQHVERTRVLAYLVPVDSGDPQAVYQMLRQEAKAYGEALAGKPHVVVLTKTDLLAPNTPSPVVTAPDARGVLPISGLARRGLDELCERLWALVQEVVAAERVAE